MKFQEKVDSIAEFDCLQFTVEVWNIEGNGTFINKKLTIIEETRPPYIDMDIYWNDRDILKI